MSRRGTAIRVTVVVTIILVGALVLGARWLLIPAGSRGLADHVGAVVQSTPTGDRFSAASLTEEPWEHLYIFGAYRDEVDVREALGFDWPDASRVVHDLPEGRTALVFTSGNEVVTYAQIDRRTADFTPLERIGVSYDPSTTFVKGPDHDGGGFPQIVAG